MYSGIYGLNQTYEDVEISDDGEDNKPLVLPAFSEQFVGDTLIVTAADGRELMRIERGKSHLYFQLKNAHQLPWQKEQPSNGQ